MYKHFALTLITLCLSGCTSSHGAPPTSIPQSSPSNSTSLNQEKHQAVSLQLTTHLGDQQEFIEGDEIQFLLSLDKNAYIYMYYIDAHNNISQILPNRNQKNNYYSAGYYQAVPAGETPYRFTINEPFGKETIWIIASDQSIIMDFTKQSIGDFKQIDASINEIKTKIKTNSRLIYGEYALNITTRVK